MQNIILWLEQTLGINQNIQLKIFSSLVVLFMLWAIHRVLMVAIINRFKDEDQTYHWKKGTGYVLFTIGALVIGRIWFEGVQAVATFLGLLSAGLAIALKDPITNIFGWIFILWRKPFEVGDRIEIGPYKGDVVDQRIFLFSIMEIGNWVDADQSTGRILHIPNGMIFTHGIANYTHDPKLIWNEIPVLVTFESNWEKAKEILQNIANRHDISSEESVIQELEIASRRFLLKYGKLTPIVYTSVKDSGILLTIRYICRPRERRGSSEALWEDILRVFAQNTDLNLAYPTVRMYTSTNDNFVLPNSE